MDAGCADLVREGIPAQIGVGMPGTIRGRTAGSLRRTLGTFVCRTAVATLHRLSRALPNSKIPGAITVAPGSTVPHWAFGTRSGGMSTTANGCLTGRRAKVETEQQD
mmetsp:Transcript_26429/g.30438  ORF Transcript_26429/g.30438 Transcript_26429/m.30438 type:complete len:107 (+) Transcript_26429:781-1101(+)